MGAWASGICGSDSSPRLVTPSVVELRTVHRSMSVKTKASHAPTPSIFSQFLFIASEAALIQKKRSCCEPVVERARSHQVRLDFETGRAAPPGDDGIVLIRITVFCHQTDLIRVDESNSTYSDR